MSPLLHITQWSELSWSLTVGFPEDLCNNGAHCRKSLAQTSQFWPSLKDCCQKLCLMPGQTASGAACTGPHRDLDSCSMVSFSETRFLGLLCSWFLVEQKVKQWDSGVKSNEMTCDVANYGGKPLKVWITKYKSCHLHPSFVLMQLLS